MEREGYELEQRLLTSTAIEEWQKNLGCLEYRMEYATLFIQQAAWHDANCCMIIMAQKCEANLVISLAILYHKGAIDKNHAYIV